MPVIGQIERFDQLHQAARSIGVAHNRTRILESGAVADVERPRFVIETQPGVAIFRRFKMNMLPLSAAPSNGRINDTGDRSVHN